MQEKFDNTIRGRKETAANRAGYIPPMKILFQRETELLAQLGYKPDSPEVKNMLAQYFNVDSHAKLSHISHWIFVCHLETIVKNQYGE